jgi:phosphatidylinositol alpha-1,6-mannosyltransferase
MRIVLTTPDYPPATGGIQLLLERLVRHSRFSYEVIVPQPPGQSAHVARLAEVTRTRRLADHRATVANLNAVTVRRVAVLRPDAVISGHVVTGPGALAARTLFGVPAIQYLHGAELGGRPGLSRLVTRRASACVAVSSHTAQLALALGAPAARIHTIPPGVDAPPDLPCRTARQDSAAEPTVLTVARLEDRYKGFDVMMRALPLIRGRVPNVRWVVVGEGSLRAELEAIADAYAVRDCVSFAGRLDDEARDGWFDRADVFAMPSRVMANGTGGEGFGLVYLEAAMHRLPSVAGDAGGGVDAVIDGETGVTVDATDHVAVADAIADLLLDPDRRTRLGEAARARAEQLSWTRMAEQVDRLVESLVAAKQ